MCVWVGGLTGGVGPRWRAMWVRNRSSGGGWGAGIILRGIARVCVDREGSGETRKKKRGERSESTTTPINNTQAPDKEKREEKKKLQPYSQPHHPTTAAFTSTSNEPCPPTYQPTYQPTNLPTRSRNQPCPSAPSPHRSTSTPGPRRAPPSSQPTTQP